jgi:predicted nucleic acid-binding protein
MPHRSDSGLLEERLVLVDCPAESDWDRIRELMAQYSDLPMDFADAALVALAERRQLRKVFTLDSDFYVYRIDGKDAFEVLPV